MRGCFIIFIRGEACIYEDCPKKFAARLRALRKKKGAKANEMSKALGNDDSYISKLEKGHKQPSWNGFFYICQYLEISPKDFFDFDIEYPSDFLELFEDFKQLDEEQAIHAKVVIKALLVEQNSRKK